MSRLELRWTDRSIGTAQTPRRFLDFVIDGESIYQKVGDFITPLGWLGADETRDVVNRLLRSAPPDFPDDRRSLYICPECGDLGCGAVTTVIERVGDQIIWRHFGFQNNYDPQVHLDDLRRLGPYSFNATEYYQTINSAIEEATN